MITGIAENVPLNSHIQFDAVLPLKSLLESPDVYMGWDGGVSAATFVKLSNAGLAQVVNSKLPDFLYPKINKKNEGTGHFSEMYLEPFLNIHLKSKADWDYFDKKEAKTVYILLLIGCLVFAIAMLNYLFISSGILVFRHKEFGIKKYLGMSKTDILWQFQMESSFIFGFSLGLALILIYIFRTSISSLFGVDFITFQMQKSLPYLILLGTLISGFSGWLMYKLYSKSKLNIQKLNVSQALFRSKRLVYVSAFQFCISMVLIVAVLGINKQLNYVLSKDLGFKSDHIINISHGAVGVKRKVLISELSSIPGVVSASASYGIPGLESTANGYKPQGFDEYFMCSALYVDDNFLKTFQIKLLDGREFAKGDSTDTQVFLINETLAKQLNWKHSLGKNIYRDGNHEVIGVVKDFTVGLLYEKIPPLIISKEGARNFYSLSIAIKPDDIQSTLKQVESTWEQLVPGATFEYSFLDKKFGELYSDVNKTINILTIFSSLSILISILGLFGITFLLIGSKIKEIGIRKVNGAKVIELVQWLNKEFIVSVLVAFMVACPLGFYVMSQWLETFAYKTILSWWLFAFAGMIAFCIAIITVSWQTIRAARRNPVEALRNE
ncbi:MAG: ABC transporter permease [Salinivirgaceae bacterium]|nr:ABC transporter permease [Salinivirgaceae bacterium]